MGFFKGVDVFMNVRSRYAWRFGGMVWLATMVMTRTAGAAPVIFTNEAEFNAAVAAAGLTTSTESFEGVEPGIHFDLDFGAFALPSIFLNAVSDDPADASDGTNSIVVLPPTFFPTFTFDRPIRAFSLDIIGALDMGEVEDLIVTIDDRPEALFRGEFPPGHIQFFGLLDTTIPFTDIHFFSSRFGDFFTIDRVRYEDDTAATPVPEPLSLTLVGLGLLAGCTRLRRARR